MKKVLTIAALGLSSMAMAQVPPGAPADPFESYAVMDRHIIVTKVQSTQAATACDAYYKGRSATHEEAKASAGIRAGWRFHNRVADHCLAMADLQLAQDNYVLPIPRPDNGWQVTNPSEDVFVYSKQRFTGQHDVHRYEVTLGDSYGYTIKSCNVLNVPGYELEDAKANACDLSHHIQGSPGRFISSETYSGDVRLRNYSVAAQSFADSAFASRLTRGQTYNSVPVAP